MEPKIKILLVEDDFEIGKWLRKRILELKNVKALHWDNRIQKALKTVKLNCPDIIILDLKLPDGNGMDFLKQIRQEKIPSKVFVFSVNNELKKNCIRNGADEFFDKNTDVEKLLEKCNECSRIQ